MKTKTLVYCPCCGEHQHPDDFDYNFERDEYRCFDCGGTFGGNDYKEITEEED
jgi:hypothetical protein